jgi:hypothetical protein
MHRLERGSTCNRLFLEKKLACKTSRRCMTAFGCLIWHDISQHVVRLVENFAKACCAECGSVVLRFCVQIDCNDVNCFEGKEDRTLEMALWTSSFAAETPRAMYLMWYAQRMLQKFADPLDAVMQTKIASVPTPKAGAVSSGPECVREFLGHRWQTREAQSHNQAFPEHKCPLSCYCMRRKQVSVTSIHAGIGAAQSVWSIIFESPRQNSAAFCHFVQLHEVQVQHNLQTSNFLRIGSCWARKFGHALNGATWKDHRHRNVLNWMAWPTFRSTFFTIRFAFPKKKVVNYTETKSRLFTVTLLAYIQNLIKKASW